MADKNVQKKADAWSKRNLSAFEGLLNVNQFLPVTGDIQSGILAAQDVKQGNYGSAALNSLGLLPFIPALGGVIAKNIPSKTQFEVAHEIAQKNAALPVSEGGLGLPKNNTAMDRAKAMGFDTTAYHGTPYENVKEFKKSEIGKNFGLDNEGFYFTSSPSRASDYAMYDELGLPNSSGQVIKSMLNMKYPLEFKKSGSLNDLINFYDKNSDFILEEIKREGYGGAKVINPVTKEATMMVLEPNQIRSVNAAFDPFRRNEADILAGLLAVPATQLMKPEEKKKKRNTK